MGFSTLRGQAQFSDSIERLKEKVLSQRQEALSTVKISGTGANACQVTLGKVLTFTPGSSDVRVETIVGANTDPPPALGCPVTAVITVSDTSTTTVPWGVTYTGSSRGNTRVQVAFYRSSTNGALMTAVSPTNGWTTGYSLTKFQTVTALSAANISFVDPAGRRAYITVTPSNNSVTRTFQ
jgi:hypothetical protein